MSHMTHILYNIDDTSLRIIIDHRSYKRELYFHSLKELTFFKKRMVFLDYFFFKDPLSKFTQLEHSASFLQFTVRVN